MTSDDETPTAIDDALMPRLRVIEDQPLSTRAEAYAQVHDELQKLLEGGDVPRTHG
ncbi:hypothetical protein G3T36_17115 [Diaminobutyricibacter tongyongensis]|uniref:Uncharacterized protein n=1 Tax=Leifsonia tongyongensis TaxID=1268043 RepID=A0A6L9Y1L5_9MICO|nr:hypothetical protein [Diaminobutyricibacter tongyongensis]NEN07581.1 hypothetical protein [Diaminobutyricibacter tongyongensis]